MKLSTREAAKSLGVDHSTLANYVVVGKVPAPETVTVGRRIVHMWTEEEIEHVRKLLPKIANGRKTRYQKLRERQGTQPRAAALHKKRKLTKKKK
jgi:predicted site-specific integrase-resolvase